MTLNKQNFKFIPSHLGIHSWHVKHASQRPIDLSIQNLKFIKTNKQQFHLVLTTHLNRQTIYHEKQNNNVEEQEQY